MIGDEREVTVLLDPYRPGALGGRISLAPVDTVADIVAITHYHEDQGWFGGLQGDPIVVDADQTVHGIHFKTVTVPHDCHGGSHMGMNRMIGFEVDGIRVLHPGDMGRLPTAEELAVFGDVDALLLPVGGKYTIGAEEALTLFDQLRPRWTIPMHYRSSKVDLDMSSRDIFVSAIGQGTTVISESGATLHCSLSNRDGESLIVLLEPRL